MQWHSATMKTTIDAAGRVIIPKEMRDRLGLGRGQPVEIRERDGHIEIEPAATPMSLVRRDGGVVAVPERDLPPLTDDMVRETVERVRR
jgi:AbrB family looped-hinge helix DNA binding protein